MEFKPVKVEASIDEIAVCDLVFAHAVFDVLANTEVLDGEATQNKISEIKA